MTVRCACTTAVAVIAISGRGQMASVLVHQSPLFGPGMRFKVEVLSCQNLP